jgi:hypothetical protein
MATTSEILLGLVGVYLKYSPIYGTLIGLLICIALTSWQRNSLDKDKQCRPTYDLGNGFLLAFLILTLIPVILQFFTKDIAQGWIDKWYGILKLD